MAQHKIVYGMKKSLLIVTVLINALVISAQSGYRGFADLGYTIGIGDYEFGRYEVNTTHGYQVCPFFYVGGGIGFHFMQKYETSGMGDYSLDNRESKVSIPLYVDFRSMFMTIKFAPFVDVKLGHFITNNDGFYANASAGIRMRTIGHQALSLSVGYVFEKLEFQTFGHFISSSNMDYTREPRKLDTEGITIKIGYEF